ncbi:MAG TPA: hypothetical protein VEV39_02575 [Gemmatimonadales bacterium]|nr:hypothetical protein [Gemmatimonadales bacterium]
MSISKDLFRGCGDMRSPSLDAIETDHAYAFFRALRQFLNAAMPGPKEMANSIDQIVKSGRGSHMAFPEGAFLNQYVLPGLFAFVSQYEGMDADRAKEALLSESWRSMKDYASESPARTSKHPFGKIVGLSPQTVVRRWRGEKPLIQSCPDLALRAPFPYRTVFEGKYFRKGGLAAAETALATDIYQAFFYRGLTKLPATRTRRPAWDYDYACVLAYDGTADGALLRAWDGLRERIGRGCWEGAGIYVMILRGH